MRWSAPVAGTYVFLVPGPEAAAVYGAMDMPWAKLVGQIAQAYGK